MCDILNERFNVPVLGWCNSDPQAIWENDSWDSCSGTATAHIDAHKTPSAALLFQFSYCVSCVSENQLSGHHEIDAPHLPTFSFSDGRVVCGKAVAEVLLRMTEGNQ